jgi:LysM repeat protein
VLRGRHHLACRVPTHVAIYGDGSHQVDVAKGDAYWVIAEAHDLSVDALLSLRGNQGVDCEQLRVGQRYCVPTA